MPDPLVRRPSFRPRATLGLVYFFGFWILFYALLVGPELWRGYHAVAADPAQWEAAQRAVQQAAAPRFWIAVTLAAAATVLGGRLGLLPGTR